MLSSAILLAAIAALLFVPAPAIGQPSGDPELGTLDGSLSFLKTLSVAGVSSRSAERRNSK